MGKPSEPLLAWLRATIKTKGLNTAHLADASGLARPRLRRILTGAEDMTVDELMLLSDALQLDPTDLRNHPLPGPRELAASLEPDDAEPPAQLHPAQPLVLPDPDAEPEGPAVDPWGNQPRQLCEIAFALGCDFTFLADTAELGDSGVPAQVLNSYQGRPIPIRLEAAYHQYNEPRYTDEALTVTLSFDALYTCTFPWTAIRQVIFFPLAPDLSSEPEPTDTPAPPGSHLRLVT